MKGATRKGNEGEDQALAYLQGKGYRLAARRFRVRAGEIDLIVEQGELLVFVEVKRRMASREGAGLEAVTPAKRRRLVKAAGEYLLRTEGFSRPLRFDVVEITGRGILHVENAFSAQGFE